MHRIYFATNRNYLKKTNPWFGTDLSSKGDLRFGHADVNTNKDYSINSVSIYPDLEQEGSFNAFCKLQESMKNQSRDTVILIHGYNVSFSNALSDSARFIDCCKSASDNSYEPNVIAYSWPSDGKLLKYVNDRRDAALSAIGLARAILKYYSFLLQQRQSSSPMCNRKVHLICHSMGNYVLRNALQEVLKLNEHRIVKLFNEILLIAADEDNDTFDFDHKLLPLSGMSSRISTYFNKNDLALEASHDVKGNMTRLGKTGPLHTITIPPSIKPIDVTSVVHDLVGHDYHIKPFGARVQLDIVNTLMGIPSEEITGRRYIPQAGKYSLV